MARVKLEGPVISYGETTGSDGWPAYYWEMTNRYGELLAWGTRLYNQVEIDDLTAWLRFKLLDMRRPDTGPPNPPASFDPSALRFVVYSDDPPFGSKTVLYHWCLENQDGDVIARSSGGSGDYTEDAILNFVKWLSSSLGIKWEWARGAIRSHRGDQQAQAHSR